MGNGPQRQNTPSGELSPAATELLTQEGLTKAQAAELDPPPDPLERRDTSQPAAGTTRRGAESSLGGCPHPSRRISGGVSFGGTMLVYTRGGAAGA